MCETPESNQTSRMSVSFSNDANPRRSASGGRKSSAGRAYHASPPSFAKIPVRRSKNFFCSAGESFQG
jgi:hypothetical protein